MIISRGRGYIFVHIPKTGGTALSLVLEDRAKKDDILIGDTPKAVRRRNRIKGVKTAGRLWKHSTLADIDGLVDTDELGDFFLFTLVRNPWDRTVSYYHWLQRQSFEHQAVALAKSVGFPEFVANPITLRALGSNPYTKYMHDAEGRERPAQYVRLENLAEDLAPVEAHLGFSLKDIPRANESKRDPDYRNYYDEPTAELIAKIAAEDIIRFGYGF